MTILLIILDTNVLFSLGSHFLWQDFLSLSCLFRLCLSCKFFFNLVNFMLHDVMELKLNEDVLNSISVYSYFYFSKYEYTIL